MQKYNITSHTLAPSPDFMCGICKTNPSCRKYIKNKLSALKIKALTQYKYQLTAVTVQ
jgi:hypothetical protein